MNSGRNEREADLARALEQIERADWRQPPVKLPPIDVRAVRGRLGMSRVQFARRFGFAVETVRHWERGDRYPRGSALVILHLIARNHRAYVSALTGLRDE